MANDSCLAMEDIVPAFIVGTCREFPKLVLQARHLSSENFNEGHIFTSGSNAEFFIQPLHSCIGDIDAMFTNPNDLAFTDENPVLPFDFHNISDKFKCYLIESYNDYPAYIRLRRFGRMEYNWERKIFEFQQDDSRELFKAPKYEDERGIVTYGPADKKLMPWLKFDKVVCIWCPKWPKQAKNWPFRKRDYGWPKDATIREVEQNGCHIVFAKHPACRDDVHQCRLSFSAAEIILLQSWTKVQQIVYHMLRFFAKREFIKKDCPKEDEVLCNYHLKTLMLWSCEEMSPEWWNSSSVIEVCCKLLRRLSTWLRRRKCPNYFIPEANLLHEHLNRKVVDETAEILIKFRDSDTLSKWLETHYIQPCIPSAINAPCKSESYRCVNEYIRYVHETLEAEKLESFNYYFLEKFCIITHILKIGVNGGSMNFAQQYFVKFLFSIRRLKCPISKFKMSVEFEPYFELYYSILLKLCAVHSLDCSEMQVDSQQFLEVAGQFLIKTKFIRSKHHNFPIIRKTILEESQSHFLNAQDLMDYLTGTNGHLEFKLVSQVSKGLLWRAYECHDSKSETIANASLTYLAALHFASAEYDIAINLCMKVITNKPPEEKKKDMEPLNAGCLFYIDDIIRIIGFYLLFRQIRDNFWYCTRRQFFFDLRLTSEVFAQYLLLLSKKIRLRTFLLNCNKQSPRYQLDELLIAATKGKSCVKSEKMCGVVHTYRRSKRCRMPTLEANNDKSFLSDEIIHTLMEFALENLTSFYNAICKDFRIHCNVVDCYRAACLYKRRQYPEVLDLCQRILDQPDLQNHLRKLAFANILVLPPLNSYFDGDIQCLLGLYTLVCYLSPLNEDLKEIKVTAESTFQHVFARKILFEKCHLSFVLKSSGKYHYFIKGHFLARYLQVRCLMDCDHSNSEVMFEFRKLKSNLPFEHIVRCFLQQKLCMYVR